MANTNIFNSVKSARPKRHFQDLSHATCFDFSAGKLIPFCCFDLVPGDKVKIGTQILVRAITPFVAPQISGLKVRQYWFAVPFRLLDENFPEFIAKKEGAIPPKVVSDYYETGIIPEEQNGFYLINSNDDNAFRYSVADYLGLPLNRIHHTDSGTPGDVAYDRLMCDKECLAFPWLAYNLIWNTRFRDEQLQAERILLNNEIAKVNWKKDYFTSAFLTQQAGAEPVVSASQINFEEGKNALIKQLEFEKVYLGTSDAHVMTSGVAGSHVERSISIDSSGNYNGSNRPSMFDTIQSVYADTGEQEEYFNRKKAFVAGQYDNYSGDNAEIVLDSDKFGFVFTPSAMRLAFAVQRFQEALLRGGQRYEEYTQMLFGVSPGDSRIQRPEFIGGASNPVLVSEVVQTGASEGDNKLGKLGGHGLGASADYIGSYFAKEHCLIMGLMYLAPDMMYSSQGVPKWLSRRTAEDYYAPPFAWLSEQPIFEKEIYYTGDDESDNKVFGYQGIWNDMRCRNDDVRGALRDDITDSGLNYWHMARKFGSAPELTSDFIEMNPSDRVFDISGVPHWLAACNISIKAFRPMPKYADPGLIDHVYGMR